jgi:hypothetical protein
MPLGITLVVPVAASNSAFLRLNILTVFRNPMGVAVCASAIAGAHSALRALLLQRDCSVA